MIKGKIVKCDNDKLYIIAPFSNDYIIDKQRITECEIILDDGRHLSADQRKKIYATLKDIAFHTGYTPGEVKEVMKYCYIEKTGNQYFSLSDTDMTTANEFLTFLIDFCVEWGVPCKETLLNRCSDIGRYLYACVYYRKCAVCGGKADIHEVEHVGMGRNRNNINHLNQPVQPLCRKHHGECHFIGQQSFNKKYHLESVKLDEYLCKKINWKSVEENETKLEV